MVTLIDRARPDRALDAELPVVEPSAARTPVAILIGLFGLGIALRLVWVLHNGASFDESFTAMIGRRPLGDVFDALRSSDSHPPLDYLLRLPLARAGAGDLVMRLPSLVFSVAALGLFVWWMRSRGVAGVVAVAVMAVSPFQIMYGGEARMYALLELLGVLAAILAEAWVRVPRPWHAAAAGSLVLLGVFDHVSGFLLAGGLLALAGLRRDRASWRWRGAVGCALAFWAVVWGASFSTQAATTHASWIERTTLHSVPDAVAAQVTNQQGIALFVVAAVIAGVVVILVTDRVLGRVVVCCAILPVVAAALIGVFAPFFLDRTITIAAWAPCLAVGMVVQQVSVRSRLMGVAVGVLVAVLLVPATLGFLGRHWEYDESVDHLTSVVRTGDVVATVPDWYGPLIDWRVGVREFGAARPTHVPGLQHAHAIRLGDAHPTHRVWVLWFTGDQRTFSAARCARDWSDGVTTVSCLVE